MIFYYSGTGNSLWVAQVIGKYQNERLIDISLELKKNKQEYVYELEKKEKIGFVFPTYSWAPPKIVEDFIKKIKFNGYKQNYLFSVYTCGTDSGCMSKYLDNMFKDKVIILPQNMKLNHTLTKICPTNLILFINSKIQGRKIGKK